VLLSAPAVSLLALMLLANAGATGQPLTLDCEAVPRRVQMKVTSAPLVLRLCLAPGGESTLVFDTPLCQQPVLVTRRERLRDIATGQFRVELEASEDLQPGEELSVTVCFADGQEPTHLTVVAIGHEAHTTPRVEVFRQPRSLASILREAEESTARASQCEQEKKRLLAERTSPGGLSGLHAAGLISDARGVTGLILTYQVLRAGSNRLKLPKMNAYSAEGRLGLEVCLKNEGAQPWTVTGAVLRDEMKQELESLPIWQPLVFEPGGKARCLLVEFAATQVDSRQHHQLVLLDETRQSPLRFSNITFPDRGPP
jgi:uncharacterized protein (TIGR02268 family)